jgi:hypothetical protein
LEAFDRHRVGVHEYDWSPQRPGGRRCLNVQELLDRGFAKDANGRWGQPARQERARQRFASSSEEEKAA